MKRRPSDIPALLIAALANLLVVALLVAVIIAFIRGFELPDPDQYRLLVDARPAAAPLGRDIPDQNRLFAPCPITPWALPKAQREHQT